MRSRLCLSSPSPGDAEGFVRSAGMAFRGPGGTVRLGRRNLVGKKEREVGVAVTRANGKEERGERRET